MKNTHAFFIVLMILLFGNGTIVRGSIGPIPIAPEFGDGSKDDPYQIATLENLTWIADQVNTTASDWSLGKHFVQTADIDASITHAWERGAGWTPIGFGYVPYEVDMGHYDQIWVSNWVDEGYWTDGDWIPNMVDEGWYEDQWIPNMVDEGSYVDGVWVEFWVDEGHYEPVWVEHLVDEGSYAQVWVENMKDYGWFIDGDWIPSMVTMYYEADFNGYYDGNGHTIDGLHVNRPVDVNVGLFGSLNDHARVYNLGLTNVYVYGNQSVGGLSGNSAADAITNVYTSGIVIGDQLVGGLTGFNIGTIENTYSSADVTAFTNNAGGLVGMNYFNIANSYAIGSVNGPESSGGLVGSVDFESNVTNCFWSTQSCLPATSSAGGTGRTMNELKTKSTFVDAGWNIDYTWTAQNNHYPLLKWQTKSIIFNVDWIPCEPTFADDVTLEDNLICGGFSCNNLTINPGKMLITDTGTLNIGGDLTLESSLEDGTATLVNYDGVVVDGVTNVEQYLTGANTGNVPNGRFWYLSSPVTGANIDVFKNYSTNKLWSYAEATHAYTEILNYDTPLQVGHGYVARLTTPQLCVFTGKLNTGNISVNVTRASDSHIKRGFNLIGNPYPCFLNWNSVASASEVMASIWTRSATAGGVMAFDTYNSLIGAGTSGSGRTATPFIAPMQAFWVYVDAGKTSATVNFSNDMCFPWDGDERTNRLRSSETAVQRQLLRLQVSNGTNTDETLIAFDLAASDGYDKYDSPKMSNDNASMAELYTLAGAEKVAINGLNSIEANPQLALGFTTGAANSFTIKATTMENFDEYTRIVLVDHLLNMEQPLNDGAVYTFTSDATNSANRFSLVFKTATGISSEKLSAIVFTNTNRQITVNQNTGSEGIIIVRNAVGQQLASVKTTGTSTLIEQPFSPGAYFVTLQIAGKTVIKKVLINQ
jgi:hypothetical protein